jgi:hypothetical protein
MSFALMLALMLAVTTACAGYVVTGEFVYADRAPPPPRRELVIAAPGPGYVWSTGHWAWQGREYVWVPGGWVVVQTGYQRWQPGQWRRDRHRGWYWVEGHWR